MLLNAWTAVIGLGEIKLGTCIDKVDEAAVLGESSTFFAALIGPLMLDEAVGAPRATLMHLIALAVVTILGASSKANLSDR